MKRRSALSGFTKLAGVRCTFVAGDEQCGGTVQADVARKARREGKPMLCTAHQHAKEAPRIRAEASAVADAYRERVAKRAAESRV